MRDGAEFLFRSRVTGIGHEDARVSAVRYETDGLQSDRACDVLLSTIPINHLVRCLNPPDAVTQAADRMQFRGMILVYLVLDQPQFTEYDAHYFPGEEIAISRLSEPKNYCAAVEPGNRTVLCAELPCDPQSAIWRLSDAALGAIVSDALRIAGIPLAKPPVEVHTRRLRHAYPIYKRGFEDDFAILDEWIGRFDNLVTFGRQGLFAHDNAHHALYMAYRAIDCLGESGFEWDRWRGHRREFESHIVED